MIWAELTFSEAFAHLSWRRVSGWHFWVTASSSRSFSACAVWARISQSSDTPAAWRVVLGLRVEVETVVLARAGELAHVLLRPPRQVITVFAEALVQDHAQRTGD